METDTQNLRLVGDRVASRRAKLGMSLAKLAREAGVDVKTVRSLESGERWPQGTTRYKLEKALDLPSGTIEHWRTGFETFEKTVRGPGATTRKMSETEKRDVRIALAERVAANQKPRPPMDLARLGQVVKARRAELGFTQSDIWRAGGPSDTTLSTLELGTSSGVSPSTLSKLDDALGWEQGSSYEVARGGEAKVKLDPTRPRVPSHDEIGDMAVAFHHRRLALLDRLIDDPDRFKEAAGVLQGIIHSWDHAEKSLDLGVPPGLVKDWVQSGFQLILGSGLLAIFGERGDLIEELLAAHYRLISLIEAAEEDPASADLNEVWPFDYKMHARPHFRPPREDAGPNDGA